LALSNVMVQSKSERDYTKLTPDKYGNYKTAIPSTDDSASIVIATRRSDSKLGLIRVMLFLVKIKVNYQYLILQTLEQ